MKYYIFVDRGCVNERIQIKPNWQIDTEVSKTRSPIALIEGAETTKAIMEYLTLNFGLSYGLCDEWQEFDCVKEKELRPEDVALIEYYKEKNLSPEVQTIKNKVTEKLPLIKHFFSLISPTHYMSIKELACHYDITDEKQKEAFKKRVERLRTSKKGDDKTFYKEVGRAGKGTCQYLYNVEAVREIAEEMKDKNVPHKRP